MSAGLSSLPEIKGNDVNLIQDDTLSNTDNLPAKFDSCSEEESSLQKAVGEDPSTLTGSDVSGGIDAVSPFLLPIEGNLGASAMSTHVENGESGFGHDGVDNLHGLSITRNCHDPNLMNTKVECQENHEEDLSDIKAERVNPFNSNVSAQPNQVKAADHTELMPKFLSMQNFEHDEVPASFLEDLSGLQLGKNTEVLGEATLSNLNVCGSLGFDVPNNTRLHNFFPNLDALEHEIPPTVPPPPSDPWIKIPSESQTPSTVEETLPSISSKGTPEKVINDTAQHHNALCLDGELKKAPAINPNTSLSFTVLDVPGPCEPEDLIEGIIFSANYLGTTQLISNRNPAKNARMFQAQEAVNRIKAPEGESQPTVEVDLFISTSKIKILNADTQETMMSHTLRSISYIADIGDLLVVMAKRPPSAEEQNPEEDEEMRKEQPKRHRIICHVLSSSDSHLIAESIGQCFNVSYQQFLQSNCIEPQNLTQADFNQLLDTQEMYHDDLVHYSKQENLKEIWVEKKKGETMGIAIVESGWGSIIPTVILANLQHGSPIERNGKFSIGDQIMAINGTSMVGLPLQTCHSIVKGLRNQTLVKINIVSCPPVVSVLIKRPNLKHQLGFSVQNGIICSLMRGGIAERGGVRVGHRIIEINDQSVVAKPPDKIVQMLVTSVGEIQMKTMPAAMYRLLTGQEQPIYL